MRCFTAAVGVAMVILLLSPVGLRTSASVAAEDEGFRPIFDGKTLDGWDGNPKLWRVEQGVITGETTEENPIRSNTFLIWRGGKPADFELKAEFRMPNPGFANSGIQVRSWEGPEKWRASGYQADMDGDDQYTGICYGENYRGILAERGQKVLIGADHKPKVVEQFGDSKDLAKTIKKHDWNQYHIIVQGNRIVQKINGQLMCELSDEDTVARKDGIIALQLHAGPPMKVQFRNIRLKERAGPPVPSFKKLPLTDKFYAEGAYYADFNRDGKLDVVAGPYWYEGPDFQPKHEIHPPQAFDPQGYSENFLTFVGNFNGDGWPDVLYAPWPGKDAYWYENPAGQQGPWKRHLALKDVGNESPTWADINADGLPELIYNTTGYLGYATYDPAKPDEPWVFHPVTPKGNYQRYTHGVGVGDIDGDGRIDIVEANGWWQPPANPKHNSSLPRAPTEGWSGEAQGARAGEPWIWHPFKFAEAAAQMFVYDVDGDGLNDVITVWHCHEYGLLWYKQIRNGKGEITWQQHVILPPKPDLKSDALRISQLHAVDLVDINGDGLKDILAGKRFWAHGPKGDVEPDAPAVVYWFELRRDKEKGVQFVPHKIDDDSGVGCQVTAVDLNGDGVPDVIASNKKGTFLHLSRPDK